MNTEQTQDSQSSKGVRLQGLLPLAALLLLLWQIPFIGLVQRQAGTRAFLQAVHRHGTVVAAPGRPVLIEVEAEVLEAPRTYLEQANGRLSTERTLAQVALAMDDLAGARQWLRQRLETAPEDSIARFLLGELNLRQGNTEAAVEQWLMAGARDPLLELAQTLETQEATAEALVVLEALRQFGETNLEGRKLEAEIWAEQGNPEQALALAQEIVAIAPQEAAGYELSGRLLYEAERYQEAIQFFEQALQFSTDNPRSLLARVGRSWAKLGQWSQAAAAYEQAIQANPDHHWAYALMGDAQCQLGRPDEAQAYYEQALTRGNQSDRVRQAAVHIAQQGQCPP